MGRAGSRRELFPADRGLIARMALAVVLTPLSVVGLVVALVVLLPLGMLLPLVVLGLLGFALVYIEGRSHLPDRRLSKREEPELQAFVDRLCVLADLPRPQVLVVREAQPNSWVVDSPGRPARLHVTTGLLRLLEGPELEAVLAHELSHVANRDAIVMTIVALPVAALQRGARLDVGWWPPAVVGRVLSGTVGFVAGFGSMALSRHRELTADAGAAALTGRPSALASALMKVSGQIALLPDEDLREAAGRDAFHLVAVQDADGLLRLHGRSHPSIERRVAALERLEDRLTHARRADAVS